MFKSYRAWLIRFWSALGQRMKELRVSLVSSSTLLHWSLSLWICTNIAKHTLIFKDLMGEILAPPKWQNSHWMQHGQGFTPHAAWMSEFCKQQQVAVITIIMTMGWEALLILWIVKAMPGANEFAALSWLNMFLYYRLCLININAF